MNYALPRNIHAFEFVDAKRLAYYAWYFTLGNPPTKFPIWDPNKSALAGPLAEPEDTESIQHQLSEVLASFRDHGYVAAGPITASDPWLSGGVLTAKGAFRFESMTAQRVKLPTDEGAVRAVWISTTSERKLFLWENFNKRDSLYDRSRDHTAVDRFTQIFIRELDAMGSDWWTQLLLKDFRSNPVEVLWALGAEASPALDVTMLYRLDHVCYPVTDEDDLVASFGCPIAAWQTEGQGGDEAVDDDEPITRVLVLFSVDDDATDGLTKRIRTSRLLRGLTFSFCYAIDRYGHRDHPDADTLYEKLRDSIERARPQALIVHHGVAFQRAPETYRKVLERIRGENPSLLFATDAADAPGTFTLHDIQFEQTNELHEIVKLIFG
jgi:hypothetical protein